MGRIMIFIYIKNKVVHFLVYDQKLFEVIYIDDSKEVIC